MKRFLKYIANLTLRPAVKLYLSKPRSYNYNGIKLTIPPEVFHPAFFFSTKILLHHLLRLDLKDKTFLELGAGSGLISFSVANAGARVTATDINKTAVEYLYKNAQLNNINIEIIKSDLFEQIPAQAFDIIAINPPYYKRKPSTEAEHAWYCGENGEYFTRLFSQIAGYMHYHSIVLMVISDDSDLEMIKNIAVAAAYTMQVITAKKTLWERHYIFQIKKAD